MKKVILYAHGGSKNHGCEAIVRSTQKVLNKNNIKLYSLRADEDFKYGLNKIVDINSQKRDVSKFNIKRVIASLNVRVLKNERYAQKITYNHIFNSCNNNTVALSIGGDVYCYKGIESLAILNEELNKKGTKTVLWGCSVEPDIIKDKVAKDLARYSLIVARESITYEAIKKVNKNTVLIPDCAFQLDKIEIPLPKGFEENNTIGINVSPLIIDCENKNGITMANYESLIHHIIDTTDMKIALIPHVVWDENNDMIPLNLIYDKFKDSGRVILIQDCNCLELKGYISRCRMFIGARTHATIAAYSTCVPTLVVGYSVKAKGIAKDIFGTYENYVLPVQSLNKKEDLISAFEWLKNNESKIKNYLNEYMPNYKNRVLDINMELNKVFGEL